MERWHLRGAYTTIKLHLLLKQAVLVFVNGDDQYKHTFAIKVEIAQNYTYMHFIYLIIQHTVWNKRPIMTSKYMNMQSRF